MHCVPTTVCSVVELPTLDSRRSSSKICSLSPCPTGSHASATKPFVAREPSICCQVGLVLPPRSCPKGYRIQCCSSTTVTSGEYCETAPVRRRSSDHPIAVL